MEIDPWASWVLSTDGLRARYCELNRLGDWLRQPANALSSGSYLLAAASVLWGQKRGPLAVATALCLLGLGIGSGFFHASITLAAQRLDMTATYLVVIALGLASWVRLRPMAEQKLNVGLAMSGVSLAAIDAHRFGTWLLPSLIIGTLFLAARVARQAPAARRTFGIAVGFMLLGGVSWALDDRKVACAPESWLQWHALWHVSTALSSAMLYRFLERSRAVAG